MLELRRLPNEPPRPYAALCSFAHLGPKRSIRSLSESLDLPVTRLRGWSSRYRWPLRVADYDLALCAEERRLQDEILKARVVDWAARREQIIEAEFQVSMDLFRRAKELMADRCLVWEPPHLISLLEIASELGRRALAHVPSPAERLAEERARERLYAQLRKAYPSEPPPTIPNVGMSNDRINLERTDV